MDYSFQVVDDEIIFDEELNGDQFMELHDIEENTLFSISSIDGVLCFTKMYEDDDEPDEEDWTGDNILAFVRQ